MLGSKALGLGLIDGLGDVRSIIRAQLGDQAKADYLGPKRKWSLMRLFGGAGSALVNALEAEQWRSGLPK